MEIECISWLAIPFGLAGMAIATKTRWGFALMLFANLLWVINGVCCESWSVATSSGIYAALAFRNTMQFGTSGTEAVVSVIGADGAMA